MPADLDVALLDEQLENLLDLTLAERELRLLDLQRTEPELADVLRKLLRLATDAQTADLRQAGDGVALVEEHLPPPLIEGYRIEGEIASGGMATVYAAERDVHGLARPVAIKLLRTVMLSPLDRERFLNEQRILARLQHSNIATLLDVGVVNERPYMVMERIEGEPIDQRLKVAEVGPAAILQAFLQVLDAVALAHSHFVIHRDIKPDNVLLDAQGRVRLIDFGIAKILDESGGLRSDPTLTGLAPMTLRYASPEQLGGRPVGVASDIYQLGLLLYHLLSGAWPYDEGPKELPSERARPDSLPQPASARVTDRSLRRALLGDLDSILLKCLRYDPADRYRSVGELREDIERHLGHRPVHARQQTRGYRLRSFVRRHRLGVALGAMTAVLLLLAIVSALLLATRAQQYASRTEQILDTVTEMLTQANPYERSPGSVTVSEVVEKASERFLDAQSGDPAFTLQMLQRLAGLQGDLQDYASQRALLERAMTLLEQAHADAATRGRIHSALIEAQAFSGDQDGALAAIRAERGQLDRASQQRLDWVEATIHSARGDYERAAELLDGLATNLTAMDPLFRYTVLAERAILDVRKGDFEAALRGHEAAGEQLDPELLSHRAAWLKHRLSVATVLGQTGRYDQAADKLQLLLEETRSHLGEAHSRTIGLRTNLAVMLLESARPADAYATLAAVADQALADAEPNTRIYTLITRGGAALHAGAPERALADVLDGVELATEVLGTASPRMAYPAEQLAWTLFELGQLERAAAVAEHAWRLSEGSRHAADLILQLTAEGGVALAGRPDAGFLERAQWECDRVHYRALQGHLYGTKVELPERVPDDCSSLYGMRLEALGLRWEASSVMASERSLQSPILARGLRAGVRPPPLPIAPAVQARLAHWLQRMDEVNAP